MSIERIFYCDATDCQRHAHTVKTSAATFITVTTAGRSLHFCSWDCLLKYAAGEAPVEELSPTADR
jgi:hypothetical protein